LSPSAPIVSFNGESVEVQLTSPYLVLIDPLALDGLRTELQETAAVAPEEQRRILRAMQSPLRIGVHEIMNFRPGRFRVSPNDFQKASSSADSGVVDVDTGSVVLADLPHLARLAEIMTWDRYDQALQSPVGDDSAFLSIQAELGGLYFALISASADAEFDGDGAFRLRDGAPAFVA
jgi:hypothetical protein